MGSIIEEFEKPLSAFPEFVEITYKVGLIKESMTIPTSEVYQSGDWLARQFAGVTFPKINKYLIGKGIFADSICVDPKQFD